MMYEIPSRGKKNKKKSSTGQKFENEWRTEKFQFFFAEGNGKNLETQILMTSLRQSGREQLFRISYAQTVAVQNSDHHRRCLTISLL